MYSTIRLPCKAKGITYHLVFNRQSGGISRVGINIKARHASINSFCLNTTRIIYLRIIIFSLEKILTRSFESTIPSWSGFWIPKGNAFTKNRSVSRPTSVENVTETASCRMAIYKPASTCEAVDSLVVFHPPRTIVPVLLQIHHYPLPQHHILFVIQDANGVATLLSLERILSIYRSGCSWRFFVPFPDVRRL